MCSLVIATTLAFVYFYNHRNCVMLFSTCLLATKQLFFLLTLIEFVGHVCAHQLILYDQHRHMIKNKISFEDIVTVRSCRDCIFQVTVTVMHT